LLRGRDIKVSDKNVDHESIPATNFSNISPNVRPKWSPKTESGILKGDFRRNRLLPVHQA
jgi:hypothetical protein